MARGWESKAVESQQAETGGSAAQRPRLTPEARARADKRKDAASRGAGARRAGAASQPAHRAMLERAAADLDLEITALSS